MKKLLPLLLLVVSPALLADAYSGSSSNTTVIEGTGNTFLPTVSCDYTTSKLWFNSSSKTWSCRDDRTKVLPLPTPPPAVAPPKAKPVAKPKPVVKSKGSARVYLSSYYKRSTKVCKDRNGRRRHESNKTHCIIKGGTYNGKKLGIGRTVPGSTPGKLTCKAQKYCR